MQQVFRVILTGNSPTGASSSFVAQSPRAGLILERDRDSVPAANADCVTGAASVGVAQIDIEECEGCRGKREGGGAYAPSLPLTGLHA